MSEPADTSATDAFARSRARIERLVEFSNSEHATGLPLAELEAMLEAERRELVNVLMYDHAQLRAEHERDNRVSQSPQHASQDTTPAAP